MKRKMRLHRRLKNHQNPPLQPAIQELPIYFLHRRRCVGGLVRRRRNQARSHHEICPHDIVRLEERVVDEGLLKSLGNQRNAGHRQRVVQERSQDRGALLQARVGECRQAQDRRVAAGRFQVVVLPSTHGVKVEYVFCVDAGEGGGCSVARGSELDDAGRYVEGGVGTEGRGDDDAPASGSSAPQGKEH